MMKTNPLRFITVLFAIVLTAQPGYSGILLDKSIVDFPAGEPPRQDVTVTNQSNEIAYVKVEVLQVSNPGTDQEKRTPVNGEETIDFVASPAKLAISPGGRKQVRMVSLADPGDEKVYRINFTPVLPPLEETEEEGIGVRIVVAYQVLALIHPAEPVEKLIIKRDPISITFDNQGNSYALITNVTQCDKKGENCIDDLGSKRLYAGNKMTIAVPYQDTPISYRVTNFKGAREETFK
jgi:P pilus assembly chaperone PapD